MYRLISIDRIDSPCEHSAHGWYRYVIANERGNTITGQRAGTRKEVAELARQWADGLNRKYGASPHDPRSHARPVNLEELLPLYR